MAEPAAGVLYADTSALVKLVIREAESEALGIEISRWDRIATSDIAAIELARATARARAEGRAGVADGRVVLEVLAAVSIVPMTDEVRALAATLEPVELRTLDAIHLGCALALGDDLAGVLTYDRRMPTRRTRAASPLSLRPDPPPRLPRCRRSPTSSRERRPRARRLACRIACSSRSAPTEADHTADGSARRPCWSSRLVGPRLLRP